MLFLADANGYHRFQTMQNHLNLVYREEEREMIPLCLEQGVGLVPWSPLARGFLAGNRRREGKGDTTRGKDDPFAEDMYYRDEDFDVVDAVVALATELGKTPRKLRSLGFCPFPVSMHRSSVAPSSSSWKSSWPLPKSSSTMQ